MMEAGQSHDPQTSQRMQTSPLLLVVKEEVVDGFDFCRFARGTGLGIKLSIQKVGTARVPTSRN